MHCAMYANYSGCCRPTWASFRRCPLDQTINAFIGRRIRPSSVRCRGALLATDVCSADAGELTEGTAGGGHGTVERGTEIVSIWPWASDAVVDKWLARSNFLGDQRFDADDHSCGSVVRPRPTGTSVVGERRSFGTMTFCAGAVVITSCCSLSSLGVFSALVWRNAAVAAVDGHSVVEASCPAQYDIAIFISRSRSSFCCSCCCCCCSCCRCCWWWSWCWWCSLWKALNVLAFLSSTFGGHA